MSGNYRKPARMFPSINAVHGIRHRVRMVTPDVPADGLTPRINMAMPVGKNVHIGTVPAGAIITRVSAHVKTAFDGAAALSVGTEADIDGVVTPAQTAVDAAGFKPALAGGALMGTTDVELELFARLDGAGVTVGEADILIEFYVNKD